MQNLPQSGLTAAESIGCPVFLLAAFAWPTVPCATRGAAWHRLAAVLPQNAHPRLPTATHVVHRRAVLRSPGPAETSSSQRASRQEPCARSRSKHAGYMPVHDVSLPPRPIATPTHPPARTCMHASHARRACKPSFPFPVKFDVDVQTTVPASFFSNPAAGSTYPSSPRARRRVGM